MTIEALTVTSEFTTIDLLLWRRFRREVSGLVEDTLRRNPGLARKGIFLPVGTQLLVQTPPPPPSGRAAVPVISLYD